MKKIDGNKIAQQIIAELKERSQPTKRLVAVLVGNNEGSVSFLKKKEEPTPK